MSGLGLFLLVCLFIMRLIPEAMTLLIVSLGDNTNRDCHTKSLPFWLLAFLTGGIHAFVYVLLHRRFLLSWNILDTIAQIGRLDFVYQNVSYFTKSFLICMVFALLLGAIFRRIQRRMIGHRLDPLSSYQKSGLLLLSGVLIMGGLASYHISSSGHKKLIINEVCSNNVAVFLDEDGKICDYVELYNDGWLPYLVMELYLSDDVDDLKKYEIPLNILHPQEYQIVPLDENIPFRVSEQGETIYLSDGEGQILEQVECVALEKDTSYSRMADGSFTFETRTCTPGRSNLTSKPVLSPPVFSHESGFYSNEFELELFAEEGRSIFYTLDGSIPTREAFLYEGAIAIDDASDQSNRWSMRKDVSTGFLVGEASGYETPNHLIDKCTIVRAMSMDEEGNESPVVSATYFVDFQEKEGYQGMHILSLIMEPDDLFGYENGIYVTGKLYEETKDTIADKWFANDWWWWIANYTQKGEAWEREACLQFFDKNGNLFLTKDVGVRVQGGGSRGKLPRSLNLYARNAYDGSGRFEVDFFGSSYRPKRVTLFAGGDDNLVKLKDCLAAKASANRSFSTMDFEPYVLFLNGEYWGCYWLTEKYDEEYFEHYYHIDGEKLLMIKCGRDGLVASQEDEALFYEMRSAIIDQDLSIEENYRKVCEIIDVDSFIDYYATQIYIAHWGDWPASNYALWRTREIENGAYSDGRWRWILFDVNSSSMDLEQVEVDTYQEIIESDPLFASMMENPECHERFVAAILERAYNDFLPEKMDAFLTEFEELMKLPLKKEYERFYGMDNQKQMDFEREVEEVRAFFDKRYEYITNYFAYNGGRDDE